MGLETILGTTANARPTLGRPPRIIEVGKIKIGGKAAEVRESRSGGTYRVPEKHDYFTLTTTERDANGDFLAHQPLMESLSHFADADGRLRQLPILVSSDTIEDFLHIRWVWYVGDRLAGESDGVKVLINYDRQTKQWLREPLLGDWGPKYAEAEERGQRLFRLATRLDVQLASVEASWGGCYCFRTLSEISAHKLFDSLTHIRDRLTCGVLQGLPLRLKLTPQKVRPGGKPSTVYVTHIELVGSDLGALHYQTLTRSRLAYEAKRFEPVAPLPAVADREPPDPVVPGIITPAENNLGVELPSLEPTQSGSMAALRA